MVASTKPSSSSSSDETSLERSDRTRRIPTSLTLCAVSACAMVRVLVGYSRHSGQDNYHGSATAYGGDAEAQRHWMELTYHLPIGEWYYHDLEYWGLDYPPLTAYVSYVCGALAHIVVGPHSVALYESRYQEMDVPTKAFLRSTVIALDLGLYATAVWWILKDRKLSVTTHLYMFVAALLQPAILLIDHGHFQYNTTALGLALWSFHFMTQPQFNRCILASMLFVCALSFKQMTLYYAPAVFSYLLARCLKSDTPIRRFVTLGVTVVVTFVVLWWPFVIYGPDNLSYAGRLQHVLHRILPFQRGLFESKVSNVWCVLSLKPIRIRERLSADLQPVAALLLTFGLMLPSCVSLYRNANTNNPHQKNAPIGGDEQQRDLVFRGTTACAIAFFLASFQVHEKSLLIALAPASLLLGGPKSTNLRNWFGIFTAWTLWPLMRLDRLEGTYVCTILLFYMAASVASAAEDASTTSSRTQHLSSYAPWLQRVSYAVMAALHLLEFVVPAPAHLPDVYPVLWSVVGCALVGCMWLILSWQLLTVAAVQQPSTTVHKVKVT